MSNEKALQDAWVKLQTEKADLLEAKALSVAAATAPPPNYYQRMSDILGALHDLKEARSIRGLLSKIESIADR